MPEEEDDSEESGGPGEFRIAKALRKALPTRVHAEMLLSQVADLLGPAAWSETSNAGTRFRLFRRDPKAPDLLVPWPVVSLDMRGNIDSVGPTVWMGNGEPPPPPARPAPPKIRGIGPGEVRLHDGPHAIHIAYHEDGGVRDITRSGPEHALVDLDFALAGKSAQPVELIAGALAGLDHSRHGSGRLAVPVPLPCGVRDLWSSGLRFLRDALFHDRVPAEASWAAAGCFTGDALGWGATAVEALAAWRVEVGRMSPWPPRQETPTKPPTEEEARAEGVMRLVPDIADNPWPERTPAHAPAALVALGPPPAAPAPVGTWKRLLNGFGATTWHALRPETDGLTLIGERTLRKIPLDELDDRLREADEKHGRPAVGFGSLAAGWPEHLPPLVCSVRVYKLVDPESGKTIEPCVHTDAASGKWVPGGLDGDELKWGALRLRWLEE